MSQQTEPKLPENDIPESVARRQMIKSFGWFALASAVPVGYTSGLRKAPVHRVLNAPSEQF
ncbi:hypothetical protein [Spirosoma telluris]|uniref:hypothetical protein n=1 Tax=Spirosoma telluris TaxID=2183553 RepID=UPI002FC3555B